jgi:hypothetical protein
MMILLIIALLTGMLLGQHFKVFILLPAVTVVFVITVATGAARAEHLGAILLMALGAATALQIGYLAVIAVQSFLAVRQASHDQSRAVAYSSHLGARR